MPTNGKTKKPSHNRFRRAADHLREMDTDGRIQMLVKAGLMSQKEADEAKSRHRQADHGPIPTG